MYALIAVVVVLVAFVAFVASRPPVFRVERSTEIDAAPDRVYPLVADFHNWETWSPFEKYDPAMTRTFSGAPSGNGAVYEWSGNSRAGRGRMEITDAIPSSKVAIDLHFIKPFEARNDTVFTLQPAASSASCTNGTRVTWAMSGKNNFMGKLFHVFVNMDRMVGKDFEEGLANLKRVTERERVSTS